MLMSKDGSNANDYFHSIRVLMQICFPRRSVFGKNGLIQNLPLIMMLLIGLVVNTKKKQQTLEETKVA